MDRYQILGKLWDTEYVGDINFRWFFYNMFENKTPNIKPIYTIFAHSNNQIHPVCRPIYG